MGWRKPDNWVLDNTTAIAKVTGEGAWVQKEAKTWTYKLYELLLNTPGDARIPCKIRGPYGSSFRLCFARNVKGALIMGAGTGLSAVESMLRAMLHRKKDGKYIPNHVSCNELQGNRCWTNAISYRCGYAGRHVALVIFSGCGTH